MYDHDDDHPGSRPQLDTFGPEVLLAVDAACAHAGAQPHVVARCGTDVALVLDAACFAAVIEAASGFGAGENGAWADTAVAEAPGHAQEGLSVVLAVAADGFDRVLDAAVDGPVWFRAE